MTTSGLTPYQETIKHLSERIVSAQKPILILDAIKWTSDIKSDFFARGCKSLPKVDAGYYNNLPLPFNIEDKQAEFAAIEKDIARLLGQSGVARLMQTTCREYRLSIAMLGARGTPEFSRIAKEIYGASTDTFYEGSPRLIDLADMLSATLTSLTHDLPSELDIKKYNAFEAAAILNERLKSYFFHQEDSIAVIADDNIIADAAAGARTIKMRSSAMFSDRDLRLLEVHEGWVHVGTSINGNNQPICTFLGKGAPSSVITQEGLAVIMEIFTFSSHPVRMKRITDRIKAINMVEAGADFVEVFHYFTENGLTPDEAYSLTTRVFRGSTPLNGAFSKDLSYAKGFILIYNYIRLAIQSGLCHDIPNLFSGKLRLDDLKILSELMQEGIVVLPRYVPAAFKDLSALGSWMCFSLFLNQLDLKKLADNYKEILQH